MIILLVTVSCSTEKNTFVSRSFNGVNAKYNGLFNANELLRLSLDGYRANLDESYYDIVPIDPVPSETEVEAYYAPIDTAIAKCTKVITDHSMPSNDKPSKKNAEHNNWIDENWITIGKASFYRRDYDGAMRNFKFIKKFFEEDASNYLGELWMAKTNIKLGQLTEAKFNIDNLDKALEEQKSGEASKKEETTKKSKSKSKAAKQNSKKGSSKDKEKKKAKFPKKIMFDFEKTKADLALANNDKGKAILHLEESLKHGKKSSEVGRVHFVLGQLYEEQGNVQDAARHYKKAKKKNIPFKMAFTARMKYSMLNNGGKQRKELKKMLRDAKNAEFKDQIYYALAQVELSEGNEDLAVEYLTECAFYSSKNTRQKGMAYEQLGDLRFAKRDYIRAQKYYDSCAVVIGDDYPNADAIRSKASNLADLVIAVETAQLEDSLQRIAKLDPEAQEAFLKNVIKKTKEEEQARKQREAEKLRALQASQGAFNQNSGSNSSKFYWNNPKTMAEGYDEFVKLWGKRENTDDWRRSQKTQVVEFKEDEQDTTAAIDSLDQNAEILADTLTVEYLSAKLPKTEEDFAASNARLLEALYNSGVIYKEQLNEKELAKKQFNSVIDREVESEFNLMSAFQLYKMYETADPTAAATQKGYILDNYPNSDYANFLRDPDYFIKKKERDALAEQEYVTVLNRYNRKVYAPVQAKAEEVIENELDNEFRSKYMLLYAMCLGQTTEDKKELLPILERVKKEYPKTPEATRAQELIDIINNGYSVNQPTNFDKKFDFAYEEKQVHFVLIFLGEKDNPDLSKNKVSDFNKEFFPKSKVKVSSKLYGDNQSVIALQDFATENEAKDYVRKYKATRKYLLDLQKATIIVITPKNMKTLFDNHDLQQYQLFYDEFY